MIDTDALRKKVIDLAIRGKLTEQLPSDGDAESLYAKIQEEKEKCIAAGKLKKENSMPSISENDIPFDIPHNWQWVYMGEIFDHNTGKALNNADKDGVKLEYITTSNMYWDHFELDGLKSMYFKESEIEKCTITKGDLLICEGGDIGRSAIWAFDYDMRIQNHIHKLRGYGGIEHKFYFYIMRNYKDSGMIDGRGIGLQGFSSKRVHSLIVPLPPLAEQKRIVEKLDTVLAQIDIIDILQQQYASDLSVLKGKIIDAGIRGKLTEQLPEDGDAETLYSQIQEEKVKLIKEGKIKKEKPLPEINADEIPYEIPKNWKWVRLGTISTNIQYGTSKKSQKSGMVPVIRMGNIINGRIDYNDLVYTSDKDEIKTYSLSYDDLLFNRTNSWELVGKTAIYKGEKTAIFAGYLIRITPVLIDADYLNNYMQSDYYSSCCEKLKVGAVNQANINSEKLKNLLVPLPPLKEQKRITKKIGELLEIVS